MRRCEHCFGFWDHGFREAPQQGKHRCCLQKCIMRTPYFSYASAPVSTTPVNNECHLFLPSFPPSLPFLSSCRLNPPPSHSRLAYILHLLPSFKSLLPCLLFSSFSFLQMSTSLLLHCFLASDIYLNPSPLPSALHPPPPSRLP